MKNEDLANNVLSLLFASASELTEDELMQHTGASRRQVREALQKTDVMLASLPMQVMLKDEKKRAWKLTLKAKYLGVVQGLGADTELTKGALDVLAIIAYKEPMLQSEIIHSLGTGSYDHIKMLLEAGFITKQPKGRSFTLKLADNFYKYFEMTEKDSKRMLSEIAAKNEEKRKSQKSIEEFNSEEYGQENESPGSNDSFETSENEQKSELENDNQESDETVIETDEDKK